ncbi:hypothetical protein [Stieleria varia]|uniref:Uncharacterized protein n=1 Tax=Stieleria varia TaxID=2528005 RepID=A0A5C6B354_9BACT|nr:hypothetical protein [Stieleria varia]TWU05696.1 hypothetical protein Pla52n_14110 [Stieleria varia]
MKRDVNRLLVEQRTDSALSLHIGLLPNQALPQGSTTAQGG